MAVLDKEEYMKSLHGIIGTDTSETSLKFIDDFTDTYLDMEKKINGDGVDWKKKYEENDKSWREKYINRFATGSEINIENRVEERKKPVDFKDLFE